jgi:hypothetical protein
MIRSLLRALGFGKPDALMPRPPFEAGDLLSIITDDNQFGVVKVLAADAVGVHARLYVQRFARRPHANELGEFSTAPFGPEYGNPFSIGHMPLSHASFATWQPELIVRGQPVVEEELEGFRMWLKAEAGYF